MGAVLGHNDSMLGPIIMVVVLLVVIPVGFLMTMALPAAVIGHLLRKGAENDNPDSELLETNY